MEKKFIESMRLVRFLTFADAKRVLSEYSSFCLCSTLYYWQQGWENPNSSIGDTHKNIVKFVENGQVTKHCELLAATLISCWTILDQQPVGDDDWRLYPDRQDGIAIVSTVKAVEAVLTDLAKDILDNWIFCHDDGAIKANVVGDTRDN
jgi:hypothetical protein